MGTWVGTSGYNYPEWKGSFYPPKLPAAKMLSFYAQALSTVEINYTFYRVPNTKILAGWDRETPAGFRLVFSQRLHLMATMSSPSLAAAADGVLANPAMDLIW